MATSREAAIAAIERSRRDQQDAHDTRVTTRSRAYADAEAALGAAVAGHPLASAIHEAFRDRLRLSEEDCERQKGAVLAQMRRELEAIGG